MPDVVVFERRGEKDGGSAACALAFRCALDGRFTFMDGDIRRVGWVRYFAETLASEYRAEGRISGYFRNAAHAVFEELADDLVSSLGEEEQAAVWRRFRDSVRGPIIFAFRDALQLSLEACRTLHHPETGISVVRIDVGFETRFTPVEWRSPVSVAVLSGDLPDPEGLENHRIRLRTFTVDEPIAEIALRYSPIGASSTVRDPDWLLKRFRCRLIVIPDNPALSTQQVMDTILPAHERLNAPAVALVPPYQDRTAFLRTASALRKALANDMPVQQALVEAFGPGVTIIAHPGLSAQRTSDSALDALRETISTLPDTALEFDRDGPMILTKSGTPLRGGADLRIAVGEKDIDLAPDRIDQVDAFRKRLERTNKASRAERRAGQSRFLQRLRNDNDFGFTVGVRATEFIQVGPEGAEAQSAGVAFPEHLISQDPAKRTLQVVFYEPNCMDKPRVKDLDLPLTGASRPVAFDFVPKRSGPFEARVTVLYRGRILQTALIYSHVHEQLGERPGREPVTGIAIETRIRPDLEDFGTRRDFQLTLMANRNIDGHRRIVAIADHHADAVRLDALSAAVDSLDAELSKIATSPTRYSGSLESDANRLLFENLALWGAELFAVLRETWARDSDGSFDPSDPNVRRIQLITVKHDEVIPLEYVYDRPSPRPGATVCPAYTEALETGECPSRCAGGIDPSAHVCPLGFWGLSKTIERHCFDTIDGDYEDLDLIVQSVPDSVRDTIGLGPDFVFGYSDKVQPADVQGLLAFLSAHTGQAVHEAENWNSWKAHVRATSSSLLLAYPHNDGHGVHMTLEIQDDALRTSGLSQEYVLGPSALPPIVALLGCDTSSSAQRFVRHISQFRRANAGLIVATIATLHAKDAPPIGEALVKALFEIAGHEPAYFGDALRIAKRRLLLQGIPAALSLVAFGDADWKITLTP